MSLPARRGRPAMGSVRGSVRATMSLHCGHAKAGARGNAMQGRLAGTASRCCSQVSSLPMKSRLASL